MVTSRNKNRHLDGNFLRDAENQPAKLRGLRRVAETKNPARLGAGSCLHQCPNNRRDAIETVGDIEPDFDGETKVLLLAHLMALGSLRSEAVRFRCGRSGERISRRSHYYRPTYG